MIKINEEIMSIVKSYNEDSYTGPNGKEYISKDFPEGTLSEDFNSGIISFYIENPVNEKSLTIYGPEDEFNNTWAFMVYDNDKADSIYNKYTNDAGIVELGTNNWNIAKNKIREILIDGFDGLFKDFSVPQEAIDIIVKYNEAKDTDDTALAEFRNSILFGEFIGTFRVDYNWTEADKTYIQITKNDDGIYRAEGALNNENISLKANSLNELEQAIQDEMLSLDYNIENIEYQEN